MSATLDTNSAGYVRAVAEGTAAVLGRALVGTYLHGSAVLGGFAPARSDLDLLTVTTGPLDTPTKQQLATALAPHALPCPAVRGLELSGVTRTTTLAPTPTPPFELHLATSNQTTRVVDGRGHPGDPDLLLQLRGLPRPRPPPHRTPTAAGVRADPTPLAAGGPGQRAGLGTPTRHLRIPGAQRLPGVAVHPGEPAGLQARRRQVGTHPRR
jgi:hypothetical protein